MGKSSSELSISVSNPRLRLPVHDAPGPPGALSVVKGPRSVFTHHGTRCRIWPRKAHGAHWGACRAHRSFATLTTRVRPSRPCNRCKQAEGSPERDRAGPLQEMASPPTKVTVLRCGEAVLRTAGCPKGH